MRDSGRRVGGSPHPPKKDLYKRKRLPLLREHLQPVVVIKNEIKGFFKGVEGLEELVPNPRKVTTSRLWKLDIEGLFGWQPCISLEGLTIGYATLPTCVGFPSNIVGFLSHICGFY